MPLVALPSQATHKTGGLVPLPSQQQSNSSNLVGDALQLAKKTGEKAIEPLVPILEGTGRLAGTGVGKAFDFLNRASAANQARAVHGAGSGWQTFVHSETPEQYQADTAELARRNTGIRLGLGNLLPGAGGPFHDIVSKLPSVQITPELTKEEYDKLPGIERGALEFLTNVLYDPTTYAGGTGILKNIGEKLGEEGLIRFARAANVLEQSRNTQLQSLGKGLKSLYDFTHYKGAVARDLASKYGKQGIQYFRGLKAIKNAMRGSRADLANTLIDQYHQVIKGLSEDDESKLFAAIHTGTVDALPENLQQRAFAFKRVTDSLAYLSGTPELREYLGDGKSFTLPENMQRFDKGPRNLQEVEQYRQDYVPTAHDMSRFVETPVEQASHVTQIDQTATAGERSLEDILKGWREEKLPPVHNPLTVEDKNLLERSQQAQLLKTPLQRKVIEARLKSGAASISAHDAEKKINQLFGANAFKDIPNEAKAFFAETYHLPGGAQFWKNLTKGLIDIPKVGMFYLPFRHMANISTMLALAGPASLPGTAGRFIKLLAAGRNAEKRAGILGEAVEHGVTGTPSIDRSTTWVGKLNPRNAVAAAVNKGLLKPDNPLVGWTGKIPGIGDIYRLSNHILWSFDDAAKATLFDRTMKSYMRDGIDHMNAAYKAADEVGAQLMNYAENSPLTEALRYIFPFATYRGKLPGVVARAALQHPERVLALGRLSPAMVGDVQDANQRDAQGNEMGVESKLPLAEVMRGFENPFAFLRSSVGYPAAMAASLGADAMAGAAGDYNPFITNYMTYGKNPDLRYLANATAGSFPGVAAGLKAIGQGEFANQGDVTGALGTQTGFSLVHGPSAEQQEAAQMIAEYEQAIRDAQRHGDTQNAQAYQKLLERFKREHYLWVK